MGAIKFLVKGRSLQLERQQVLHEASLVAFLLYGNETVVRREKERSKIRAIKVDNYRGLLGIRRINKGLKGEGELDRLKKVFCGGSPKLGMENNGIAKKKKKKKKVWMLGKQGEWYMSATNCRGL